MKSIVVSTIASLLVASAMAEVQPDQFDSKAAARFANLALACVHKEYQNKISHSLNSDADVAPPRKLTPAFYGCYDWHSSVYGHWLLVRLLKSFPNASFASAAREALQRSLTAETSPSKRFTCGVRDDPALSAPMGWLGCCNSALNSKSGMILKPK